MRSFCRKIGIFQRSRAQYHTGNAHLDAARNAFHRADAAAQLHRQPGFLDDLLDQRQVLTLSVKCAVQIYNVQIGCPLIFQFIAAFTGAP